MFDICTNVHFDSHMSVWLPIVDLFFWGDLTKPAITIAGVDRFGGAEKDGHEIAGHENDGPSCRT